LIRILLVDDEAIERAGMRYLLSQRALDIEVVEADSGENALKVLSLQKIDIMITDIRMPFMDGLELVKRVRAFDRSITIAIYTAYGQFEYARKGIDLGVCAYLLKPIDPEEFHREIDKMIANVLPSCESYLHSRREGFREFMRTGNALTWFRNMLACDGLSENSFVFCICALRFKNEFFETGTRADDIGYALSAHAEAVWILDSSTAMVLLLRKEGTEENQAKKLQNDVFTLFSEQPSLLFAEGKGLDDLFRLNREIAEKSAMMNETGGEIVIWNEFKRGEYEENCRQADALRRGVKDSLKNEDANTALSGMRTLSALAVENAGRTEIYIKQTVIECLREISDYLCPHERFSLESFDKIWSSKTAPELKQTLDECMAVFEGVSGEENAVNKVLRMIHEHYMEDMRLDEIAKNLFMTPNYINYLFKRKTGQTIMRYLCVYRLERAAQLLRDTGKRVTDIMLETGYNNPSYFSSVFHAQYGQTPSQYRKKYREGS